jgi:hypothetical protein
MTSNGDRSLPRPFQMHWGGGNIVEEVRAETPYVEPTIQLLEYDGGSLALRFCYYHGARFGRGPMMIDEDHLQQIAEALREAPRIRRLLLQMAGEG